MNYPFLLSSSPLLSESISRVSFGISSTFLISFSSLIHQPSFSCIFYLYLRCRLTESLCISITRYGEDSEMVKVENVETWGFEQAVDSLKGLFSSKRDSGWIEDWTARMERPGYRYYRIGDKDLALMHKLCKQGKEYREFLNYIHFSMDATGPLSWWRKISKRDISASESIFDNPIVSSDFCWQDASDVLAEECEELRKQYLETQDFKYWKELIEKLPESYTQKRTITMNYEQAYEILTDSYEDDTQEWRDFTEALEILPYLADFTGVI